MTKSKFPSAAQVASRIDKLASLPSAVQAVLDELNDRKSGAQSVGKALEADPPLAARVLRVANSSAYARNSKVSVLRDAVSRIGTKEVRSIVTGAALAQVFDVAGDVKLRDLYLHALYHAAATGLIVERSSKLEGSARRNPYYTASLLHDSGLFALHRFVPDAIQGAFTLAESTKQPIAEVEVELLGYGHADVGATLLRRWRLSETEVQACLWHHKPAAAPSAYRPVAFLMHLGDVLVGDLLKKNDLKLLVPKLEQEALTELGLELAQLDDLMARMREAAKDVEALARAFLG